ncbi:MAG: class A beta-lactamase-related serine hydrolase [Allomuricauda sp.]|nr:MAG: class A beta-lactamase-related serine hydrolase [Allomuricauda sp.]
MKRLLPIPILLVFFIACTQQEEKQEQQAERFEAEILALKDYFKIPGLVVSIEKNGATLYRDYFGESNRETAAKVDASTTFPIASLTKVFSGVLVMKLVEQEKLSLDDPVNSFLQQPELNDSILVKHILSHTSQGMVGANFYYSSRFGLLTRVIEKASGQSFSDLMDKEIIRPLHLKNTFLLHDSTQISNMAKPYLLDDGIEAGFIDYGFSSSAGIVSNVEDLAIFNKALDNDLLLRRDSKELMFTSFKPGLPYGYGIFNQQVEGLNIVWAYGQYDCYSSLFLKIPDQNITLTLLANNSLLSDPARLIYGDLTSSLFALSFLKNYALQLDMPLFEHPDTLSQPASATEFHRKKVLAQALAASYMARFDIEKLKTSADLLNHTFSVYPNYEEYANLNLLHNLCFLKDIAFYRELGEFTDFDDQIEHIGNTILSEEPNNPYANIHMGTFYARKGNIEKAKDHFERIVHASNFSPNWYTREAQHWLNELK